MAQVRANRASGSGMTIRRAPSYMHIMIFYRAVSNIVTAARVEPPVPGIGYCRSKSMSALPAFFTLLFAATATAQITATDVAGHPVQLFDATSSKPTVLIFVRVDCPI